MKRRLRRPRAGMAAVVAVLVAATGVATAQLPPGASSDFQFSPQQGPPGTVIAISGTCLLGEGVPADDAFVDLSRRVGTTGEEPFGHYQRYPVGPDGTFNGDFAVPEAAPPDEYRFGLTCLAADQAFGTVDAIFTVTAPPTSTTSPTTVPPTTVLPPESPPARAIPGQPNFTG